MPKRFPMDQPFGWFHISFTDELPPGRTVPLTLCGREHVLLRTASGRPAVLDAYCPHLGAHLGHGGSIEGEILTCPFHGWRFTADGVCQKVPYASTPPKLVGKRCLRSIPVREANRAIYAWFHPRRSRPSFEVVEIGDLADGSTKWGAFTTKQWRVRTHIQDSHENIVDTAHFRSVHDLDPGISVQFDGHRSRTEMSTDLAALPGAARTVTHHNGPGQTWTTYDGFPEMLMMNPVMPVDADTVLFNVAIAFPADIDAKLPEAIRQNVLSQMWRQVENDIPIFENKIYRKAPPYCDNDGPIKAFRQWYRQFYVA